MFLKINVFENWAIIHKKRYVLESFFDKVAALKSCICIKKKTPTQVFFCEYSEIIKKNFYRTPPHYTFPKFLCDDRILSTSLGTKLIFIS